MVPLNMKNILVAFACSVAVSLSSCDRSSQTDEASGAFTFDRDVQRSDECTFPASTRFLLHGNSATMVVADQGKALAKLVQGEPENQLEVYDAVQNRKIVIKHPNSAVLLAEPAFSRDGRSVAFVGRPRSGMNGSEIYQVNLDTLKYTITNVNLANFAYPLPLEREGSFFAFVSKSSMIQSDLRSTSEKLNRDPVAWAPSLIDGGDLLFTDNELNFVPQASDSMDLSPGLTFYWSQKPFIHASTIPALEKLRFEAEIGDGELLIFGASEIQSVGNPWTFEDVPAANDNTSTELVCLSESIFMAPFPYDLKSSD